MLFTEHSVLSAVRSENGRRVFTLSHGDRLTPAARDLLRREGISITQKKPEHMTHLNKDRLVAKNHPRIVFRGKLDSLQSEILLLQKEPEAPIEALEDMLSLIRALMQAEVLDKPVPEVMIGAMNEAELHERSHQPQKYYGIGHFLPSHTDDIMILRLNRLRTLIRETELCCFNAFSEPNGRLSRSDILTALNRLSSACWVLCLERKGKEHGQTH